MRSKLLILAVVLPVLAGAADPSLLNLVMPNAQFVMQVHVDQIMMSPIGLALAAQIKQEIAERQPELPQQIIGLAYNDWSQYVRDVVVAGVGGKDGPALVIIRGSLGPDLFQSVAGFKGKLADYHGVPVLYSTGKNNGAIAFLPGSITLIGQPADVQAAIRRKDKEWEPRPALAEQLKKVEEQYDAWLIAAGPVSVPKKTTETPATPAKPAMAPAAPSAAAPAEAQAQAEQFLEKLNSFVAGVHFSPDFELAGDIELRTAKDAEATAKGMNWFSQLIRSQQKAPPQQKTAPKTPRAKDDPGLENFKFEIDDRHIHFSLRAPEKEMMAALQQRRLTRRKEATAEAPVTHPEISSGMPAPPPGTIRVQSSATDMGTVVLPVAKNQ